MSSFHGLIQHSFALQLSKGRHPFVGADTEQRIRERFEFRDRAGAGFAVRSVGEPEIHGTPAPSRRPAAIGAHSPLVARLGQIGVKPLPISFSGADGGQTDPALPAAFGWAERGQRERIDPRQSAPTFIFAEQDTTAGRVDYNDYLVEPGKCEPDARAISLALLRILAHKRSRLFGLALANRIVSVVLPHAILTPAGADPDLRWFVQPLVSLVQDGRVMTEFRDSYSMTLLLVPVTTPGYGERTMTAEEIDQAVNAGWSLAVAPAREKPPGFHLCGPLFDYLSRLAAPFDPTKLLSSTEERDSGGEVTLRQITEVLAFALGLRLAQGSRGRATEETIRCISDDVVTSLGSARVSSVLVVDEIAKEVVREKTPPKRHRALMAKIARETRAPREPAAYRKYRLDQDFVDDETYVIAVVPTKRCLVVTCASEAQYGWYQSGLMQAGSLTHMTIGAATAIGTLRAIDRMLEELNPSDPNKIAEIDDEIATDLREVYDLDITSEEYRRLYCRLRKHLGVDSDYLALQDKMGTLYRALSTRHGIKSQHQLNVLTATIVVLSVLTLIAGIVAASK